jgi:hypothetical protein
MKSLIISCCMCLIFFTVRADAGEIRDIELKDGSVISGEVLSLSGGIYTIKSDSLGIINLEESKIRAIRSKPSPGPASGSTGTAAGVRSLQERMMSDKEIMTMIQALQNDPEFKKALEDPEVMKAVQTGDLAALMANPKFMKLLNNARVREIEKKVK